MPATNILAGAPLFLQRRYGAVRQYVRAIIEEQFPRLDIRRMQSDDLEFIQLIAFVYILRGFFEDGHRAAKEAVRVFSDLDVHEFTIGSTKFSQDSETVNLGRTLSHQLLATVHDRELQSLIADSDSVGELVHALVEGLGYA
jgi:hypothetical protein